MNRLEFEKTAAQAGSDTPSDRADDPATTRVARVVPLIANEDASPGSAPTLLSSDVAQGGDAVAGARIGLVLDGRYRLDATLGAGGMGHVYSAMHLTLGEPVAVKFLLAQWAMLPEIRTRFRREASALAKLRHPGIVSVIDFGDHEGSLYMVMEKVQGVTLDRLFGQINVHQIGSILDQVLQVLETAHAAGVVHRDIKPENIMVLDGHDRVDRVKVLDFGIALVREGDGSARLTEADAVRGTPLYMSPEQCRGRDVGPATDVYAVGIMIYEMFSGRTPFTGETAADLSAQHMYVDPPRLDSQNGAIPIGLDPLVRRVLAKRAADRPSAAELRDELAQVLRGTDANAIAVRAAAERVRMAHLSREDRALTRRPLPPPASSLTQVPSSTVVIWTSNETRWLSLRDLLSVNGMSASRWQGVEPPPLEVEGRAVGAVILAEGDTGAERLNVLRGPHGMIVPVLVLDVPAPDQTTRLIRAGASDVLLRSAADAEIPRKVMRLLRRGR